MFLLEFTQVALAACVVSVIAQCTNPVIRLEWNQLTFEQKLQYVAAVKAPASMTSLHEFVADHSQQAHWVHGNAQFYPFHRAMLHLYEKTLAANGWPGGLVYWDWSAVSQNWWDSDIFNYFGRATRPEDNCLMDGQFAAGIYQVSPSPAFGSYERNYSGMDRGNDPTCLRRCGLTGYLLDVPEAIAEAQLKATDYNTFRGNDAMGYHANGHIILGGSCEMGNFYTAPNDPLFFMHHAFVDKTWWKWQMLCPEYVNDYEGAMVVTPATPSGVASLNQTLDGWGGGGYTVQQMLDTQNGDPLCYTYSQSLGDVTTFSPPLCPSGQPANTNWPFGIALHAGVEDNVGSSSLPSASSSTSSSASSSTSSSTISSTSSSASSSSISISDSSATQSTTASSTSLMSIMSTTMSTTIATSNSSVSTSTTISSTTVIPLIRFRRNLVQSSLDSSITLSTDLSSETASPHQLALRRREHSADSDQVLFNNLSDDGWQENVTYNDSTRMVCYNINSDCLEIPDGYSIVAIFKDFISIQSVSWTWGSPVVDHRSSTPPVKRLYHPKKTSCKPYQPRRTRSCPDSENCLEYPTMPTDEQLESRMINKHVHQCYMNKIWKSVDAINSNRLRPSIATTSRNFYTKYRGWQILEPMTSHSGHGHGKK